MKQGLTAEQALRKSITSIDGVFTYMLARPEGIGFAKDRFAMKPIVAIEENGELAAATEEQAVRRVFADECDVINYDGPSMMGIWGVGNRSLAA
jgi:glutamine phosphoribosylpyrophosphate amidotransferase